MRQRTPRGRVSERVGGKLKKGSKNRCHGTVTEVLPEMLPSVAVIVAVPFLLAFAKPFDPPALLRVTTPGVDELQVTWVVRSCVVVSLEVPVAVNCRVSPSGRLGLAGVTAIEVRVAAVTVSVVFPETPPKAAVIVMGPPAATDVANPCEPPALLIVATAVLDELQVTWVVRSCVVLSLKVPVAVNCCFVPFAMLGFVGVTAIVVRVAAVTVSVGFPETDPKVAVIVMGPPAATDVAKPCDPPALLIVATVLLDELQVTWVVRSCVVNSP